MYSITIICFALLFILVKSNEMFQQNCNVITCTGLWTNSGPIKNIEFYSFVNKTEREIINTFNWVWPGSSTKSVWDVLYKEEQLTGIKSGRYVFLNEINIILYINWLYSGQKLSWTSMHKNIPEENWNITLCFKNSWIIFKGAKDKWILTMGNVTLDSTAGNSGSIDVGPDFLMPTARFMQRLKRSPQNEGSSEDEGTKETVWNKLKGYFRELFDRGSDDKRGWLTRIADWILGFLERLLT